MKPTRFTFFFVFVGMALSAMAKGAFAQAASPADGAFNSNITAPTNAPVISAPGSGTSFTNPQPNPISSDKNSVSFWHFITSLGSDGRTTDILNYVISLGHGNLQKAIMSGSTVSSATLNDFSIITAQPNILYVGSVINGNDLASTGQLNPYLMARAGGVLTLNGVTLKGPNAITSQIIATTDEASVENATQNLVSQAIQPNQFNVAVSNYTAVYSSDQAEQAASASFSGFGADASAFFASANINTQNHVLFTFTQIFYSISYTPDTIADGYPKFFTSAVSLPMVEQQIKSTSIPMYVSSITYGRRLYFMASSTETASSMVAALQASFSSVAGPGGSVSLSASDSKVLKNTIVQVLAVGGSAQAAMSPLKTFAGDEISQSLTNYITQGLDFSATPGLGFPLYYTLSYFDLNAVGLKTAIGYNPSPVSPEMINGISVKFHDSDDDKEHQDGVKIRINCPSDDGGILVNDQEVSPPTGDNGTYWDDNTDHGPYVLNLIYPIRLADIGNCQLFVISGYTNGIDNFQSWHGSVEADATTDEGHLYNILPSSDARFQDDGSPGQIPYNLQLQ